MSDHDTDISLSLSGKVVLVTGASSGLGEHFAKVVSQAGAQVVLGARRVDRLRKLVGQLQTNGSRALAVELDVTSESSVHTCIDKIESKLGPIQVLVNNAGIADSRHCLKVGEGSWDSVMDVNLKGAWRMATAVARSCVEKQITGSIVNVSSILGVRVGFGESTYATSKAALIQLTKAMALELGSKGIRVNALCPGYVSTEMNAEFLKSTAGAEMLSRSPARRAGNLSELNGALLLLASDAGSFISGVALPVDGGHLVSSL